MSNFELHISYLDGEVVEVMEFETLRQAERAERGVRVNLDHSNYYTEIVEKS